LIEFVCISSAATCWERKGPSLQVQNVTVPNE